MSIPAGVPAGVPGGWARYLDARVPRYTSYPTANHFAPAVGPAHLREWLGAIGRGTPLSLYVHVPFCAKLCFYCGCNMQVISREHPIGNFVADLIAEIDLAAALLPGRFAVRHLHFGGGSPTSLAPEQFTAIMRRLRARFDIAADAEIAVEIDPRTLGNEMAAALAQAGVNRASMGVQEFDPEVQRAINRVQPADVVAGAVGRLRGAGIGAVGFDLLYGLPLQTVPGIERVIDIAAAMAPDRVALFGYAHVPWMKPHQKILEQYGLPGAAARWEMARAAERRLAARGYQCVGMDHFALPGDPLAAAARERRLHRNFQGYTTDATPVLIGLGPSAISALPQGYAQSLTETKDWRQPMRRNVLPTARGIALSDDDRARGALIERLMCDMQVELPATGFAAERTRLYDLARDGLIEFDGKRVRMIEEARPLVRAVAAVFDTYLQPADKKHAVAV